MNDVHPMSKAESKDHDGGGDEENRILKRVPNFSSANRLKRNPVDFRPSDDLGPRLARFLKRDNGHIEPPTTLGFDDTPDPLIEGVSRRDDVDDSLRRTGRRG